jgi:predicted Zn-dependent protease
MSNLPEWPDNQRMTAAEGWLTLRNWQEAKAELDKITDEKSRKHPDVLKAYADVWEVSGDHAAMIRYMEVLILYEPDEIDHWLRQNAALLAAGRLTEAHQRLMEILKRHPHHPALLFKLAVTLGALQKHEEAEWVLAELFTLENGKYEEVYLYMALDWDHLEPLREKLRVLQQKIEEEKKHKKKAPGDAAE